MVSNLSLHAQGLYAVTAASILKRILKTGMTAAYVNKLNTIVEILNIKHNSTYLL
jgi:hypothetical protein